MSIEIIKNQLQEIITTHNDHKKHAAEGLLENLNWFENNNNTKKFMFKTKILKARQFYQNLPNSKDILNICDDIIKFI